MSKPFFFFVTAIFVRHSTFGTKIKAGAYIIASGAKI